MDNSLKSVQVYGKIAKDYFEKFKEPSEHIDSFLSLLKSKGKILDVGCGPGVDANYMFSKGFKVIGVDLSKEMIALAKSAFPKIEFRIADMRTLDFPINSFDGLFVAYSLIHVPKKEIPLVLQKLHNLLKIGGVLYVAVQEGRSEELFVTEPLRPTEKMFLNVFSLNELEEQLNNAGFSIAKKYLRKSTKRGEFSFAKRFILARK